MQVRAGVDRGKDLIARLVYTEEGSTPTASIDRWESDFGYEVAELLVLVERLKRAVER